jgi:hypothetical protein
MSDVTAPLILDFLEWLSAGPKPYGEVMDAWRSSCPRLTIWEDALDNGLVHRLDGSVALTPLGREQLREAGRA